MQAKWQGIDMQSVYMDWAESLQECSLGSINHAINLAKLEEHPPSQGAFLAMCKTYKPELVELRIDKPKTSSEEGLKRIAEMREILTSKLKVEIGKTACI